MRKNILLNDGTKVPSVTRIIDENCGWNKRILLEWQYRELKAGRDTKDITKKAKAVGNLCHLYITNYESGIDSDKIDLSKYQFDAPIIAQSGLEQYIKIKKKHKINIQFNEKGFKSEIFRYCGRIDLFGEVYKIPSLIDIKTSKYVYQDQLIQMGAYRQLLVENSIIPKNFYIIHIDKNPLTKDSDIVKIIPVQENIIDIGFSVFKHLLCINDKKGILKI